MSAAPTNLANPEATEKILEKSPAEKATLKDTPTTTTTAAAGSHVEGKKTAIGSENADQVSKTQESTSLPLKQDSTTTIIANASTEQVGSPAQPLVTPFAAAKTKSRKPRSKKATKGKVVEVEFDHPIEYFGQRLPTVEMAYPTLPSTPIDWMNTPELAQTFPTRRNFGKRVIPKCILLDAKTDHDKLIVVNWWRSLTAEQQVREIKVMGDIYRAPTKSNDRLPEDFFKYKRELEKQKQKLEPLPLPLTHDADEVQEGRFALRKKLTKWNFRSISNAQELSEKLGVSLKALYCVEVDNGTTCSVNGCPYPAAKRNRGKCVVHGRLWYPRVDYGARGGQRGHLLLSPLYTRSRDSGTCACNDELCFAIGFSRDMVRVPLNKEARKRAIEALGVDVEKNASCMKDKGALIAPWHFHPQHRRMKFDGGWKVLKYHRKETFIDPNDAESANNAGVAKAGRDGDTEQTQEDKWIGFPPPTYSLRKFLDDEIHGSPTGLGNLLPKDLSSDLPSWIESYQKVEEGPSSLHDLKVKEMRDAKLELFETVMAREDTIFTLEWEKTKLKMEMEQLRRAKETALRRRKRRTRKEMEKLNNKKKPKTESTSPEASGVTTTERHAELSEFEDEGQEYDQCGEAEHDVNASETSNHYQGAHNLQLLHATSPSVDGTAVHAQRRHRPLPVQQQYQQFHWGDTSRYL